MRRAAAVLAMVFCFGSGSAPDVVPVYSSVPVGPRAMQASPLRNAACRGDACVARLPLASAFPFPARLRLPDDAQSATPVTIAGEIIDAAPVAMTIQNDGSGDDVLLGAVSPVAVRIAPHLTQLRDGQRVMTPLPEGIIIPAGATVLLEAGAAHLMLEGMRQPLIQGQTFPLTLRFARAGEVTVTVRVRRKLDAAGITPFPPVTIGDLTISLASAPPAPGPRATPVASDG